MPPAVALIINGISRKKKLFYKKILPVLREHLDVEILETERAGHAIELSRKASQDGFPCIVAAGGDGTLNQVVNGVMTSGFSPAVGLIPLGTGNDFAKLCGLSRDPYDLIGLLHANQPKAVDVGKIVCHDAQGAEVSRYFINACSLGMGPAVVRKLENSHRSLGPTLTYWKAITSAFFTHRPEEIHCQTPQWNWKGKIRVLVVANGRSFGNSLYIAPDASPDDGLFNTFIAGEIHLLTFLKYQQRLKSKVKLNDSLIEYNLASHLELTAPDPCQIETEGELAGYLPAKIDMLPQAIRFLR